MDAGRPRSKSRLRSAAAAATSAAPVLAVAMLTLLVLTAAGCGQSRYMDLPDLATKSPSKQAVMTPTDQRKAIDELIAKRDKQAAEAAQQAEADKLAK